MQQDDGVHAIEKHENTFSRERGERPAGMHSYGLLKRVLVAAWGASKERLLEGFQVEQSKMPLYTPSPSILRVLFSRGMEGRGSPFELHSRIRTRKAGLARQPKELAFR